LSPNYSEATLARVETSLKNGLSRWWYWKPNGIKPSELFTSSVYAHIYISCNCCRRGALNEMFLAACKQLFALSLPTMELFYTEVVLCLFCNEARPTEQAFALYA